jgi:hypothetical protein
MSRVVSLVLAALALAAAVGACNDDGRSAANATCGPPVIEQLDPDGGHLIAGATPPSYLTDPPTSGPHTPGLGVAGGVVDTQLSPIQQVSTLEEGVVIVQYRDPADAAALRRLAGAAVVVAPNADLPARVVATAWARKLTCRGLDVAAVRRFVQQDVDRYVGHATTTSTTVDVSTTVPAGD